MKKVEFNQAETISVKSLDIDDILAFKSDDEFYIYRKISTLEFSWINLAHPVAAYAGLHESFESLLNMVQEKEVFRFNNVQELYQWLAKG